MGQTKEEYNAYMREYMLKRYHKRMAYARELLGNKCAKCGKTEKLDIDHIDPTKKSFTIANIIGNCPEKKLLEELKKCQLLCRDCHVKKTRKDFGYKDGAALVNLICEFCGTPFIKTFRQVGYKIEKGQKDFYCTTTCMGKDMWKKGRANRLMRNFNDIPHGERAKYRKGCRCVLCTEASTAYNRELRNRKRRGL